MNDDERLDTRKLAFLGEGFGFGFGSEFRMEINDSVDDEWESFEPDLKVAETDVALGMGGVGELEAMIKGGEKYAVEKYEGDGDVVGEGVGLVDVLFELGL